MHKTPDPKQQARLLSRQLQGLGLTLPYQAALEVLAVMNGHKNWKTMAAALAAAPAARSVAPPAASNVVGNEMDENFPVPGEGFLFRVPVTVDMTMTSFIHVRAANREAAIELARETGSDRFPSGFDVDEGNYRGLGDFYVGSSGDVEPEEDQSEFIQSLEPADFDMQTVEATNHGEQAGELSVFSVNGKFSLSASLERMEPDVADAERRSRCTLTISIEDDDHAVIVQMTDQDYRYYGDAPGSLLRELLVDGTLLNMLARKSLT